MRRTAVLVVVVIGLTAAVAVAESVHFKPRNPTFTDNGTTLTATGALAGLGNGDIVVTLAATGGGSVVGVNPGGNSVPTKTIPVTLTGTQNIRLTIKNGTVTINVTISAP